MSIVNMKKYLWSLMLNPFGSSFPFFFLQVMGYSDTDVAEFVYSTKPSIDSLVNFLCNDLSKACSVKPPPIPKVVTVLYINSAIYV